jgi:glycosyltransferase involved in cell wall biosynthesis
VLAGLAVVLTDTPGQAALATDLADGAVVYTPGDVPTLAAGLRRWANDKAALRQAKAAAWRAAKRRWHWEHPDDRGVLLNAVAKALR